MQVPRSVHDVTPPRRDDLLVVQQVHQTRADDDGVEDQIDADNHDRQADHFTEAAKESKDQDVKAFAEKNLKSLHEHHQSAGGQERR